MTRERPPPEGDADERLAAAGELLLAAAAAIEERDGEIVRMQALLERLLQVGPAFAVVEDGVVRGWSVELERRSGIRSEDAIGRPAANLLPSLSHDQVVGSLLLLDDLDGPTVSEG